MDRLPQKIINISNAVRAVGGRAMLVGGCVRDELMGIEPKDWDLEVYGIEPTRLREILDQFGEVIVVGEAFAVYKLGSYLDVSIPRRERKTGKGHRGFTIEGDPEMSFEEACSRRDFTVNAILKDPLSSQLVDPFGGRSDIDKEFLKHVSSDTFADDSLRVLRAAQFAARLGFEIAPETVEICRTIDVTDLPKERIWGELEKILLKARRPSVGLRWLYDLNVVKQIFPELQSLVDVPQEP
jgi:tRNA nucleotidyltransferase (CCA-adding enzyme)